MIQPIFEDMLQEENLDNSHGFPFSQSIGTLPGIYYHGPHIPHDGFRPEGVLLPEEQRGTYMTDEALQLAQSVADKVIQTGIYGPVLLEVPEKSEAGTYMSPEAILLSQQLHAKWSSELRKPVPSQEFPLERAA